MKNTFNPNNIYWLYTVPPVIMEPFLLYLVIDSKYDIGSLLYMIILTIFIAGLASYSIYQAIAYKITITEDSLIVTKLFEGISVYPFENHLFVFKGTKIHTNRTFARKTTSYYRLMWIYPLDEYGERIKVESSYFEWEMFIKSYSNLQDSLAYHLEKSGFPDHIIKSQKGAFFRT